MIPSFRREVEENCALLYCYAASSGNSFPSFRDSLSVPSSRVKYPRRVYLVTSASRNRTQRCYIMGIEVIQKSVSHPKILPARRLTLDGTLRIKTNVNYLIRNNNIINCIKALRLNCFGHVHRMTNDKLVNKLYEWKPISTRLAGRRKIRWENYLKFKNNEN